MAPLQLRVIGGFAAVLPSGQPVEVSGKKNQALLTYLALNTDRKLTREKLIGLLWSDRGEAQARNSLRQALAALRRGLGGIEPPPLTVDGDSVVLAGSAVSTDVGAFEELAASASADELRRAAKLYEGDLLDGMAVRDPAFDDWLTLERSRLREVAIGALTRLMAHLNAAEAITTGQRLVALDPLREASHQALMHAYAAQGQFELAIRQYHYCRDTLRRELDVEPSAKIESLYQEIKEGRYATPPATAPAAAGEPTLSRPHKPSIAVLPFENRSDDPQQRYFADGITEDIITELARDRSLVVMAHNSSFRFRGPSVDIASVRRALGVEYIVEGSVRRAGDRIRVTAQLIDAITESHLWAERYDRKIEDVFAVQDEVTQAIVATLFGRIAASGTEQVRRKPTTDWVAYDYFLQGQDFCLSGWTGDADIYPNEIRQAIAHFTRALELDPHYVEAIASLSTMLCMRYLLNEQAETLEEAAAHAQRALALDENDAWSQNCMGWVALLRRQYDLAGQHFDRSVGLNPNDTIVVTDRAYWLIHVNRLDEALSCLDLAMQRDPYPTTWMWDARGQALYFLKRYTEALAAIRNMRAAHFWSPMFLIASLAQSGQMTDAHLALANFLKTNPKASLSSVSKKLVYADKALCDHLLEGLRKAGLPE
jgi:TolB-like protein/Tfp pilus assembly protein PilF